LAAPRRHHLICFVALTLLSACAVDPQSISPTDVTARQTLFQNGQASLECTLGCAGSYGMARPQLKIDYETQDWTSLSNQILSIGYGTDQAWYYLGRAAAGLGYNRAAKIYFAHALSAPQKCTIFVNVCDGLDIPSLAQTQLAALDTAPDSAAPDQAADLTLQPGPVAANPPAPGGGGGEIHLVKDHGAFEVPVLINGVIPLNFIIDSGASDVSIPADVVLTLLRTGTVKDSDFIGTQTYTLADGSTTPSAVFMIRSLKVGSETIHNIRASISDIESPLLLGQSFLSRFNSWSIDNSRQLLILR
jgi:clan AA aspartic protease (TIGR02281 family)